jgi:hypothetical protein
MFTYAGEEVRGDHGLAQVVDLAAVVELASVEAGEDADMFGIERKIALRRIAAEQGARAGCDGEGVVAAIRLGIQEDVACADLGEGIALFRKAQEHIGFGALHIGSDDGVASLERERLARERRGCGFSASDIDLAKLVSIAGHRRHDHPDLSGLLGKLLDRGYGSSVIIALRPQDPDRQRLVFPGAGGDLGAVRRLAVAILQRREFAETPFKLDLLKAFHRQRVPHRSGTRVGLGVRRRRGHVERGERRQWLGEGGIWSDDRGRSLELRTGYDRHNRFGRGKIEAFDRLQRSIELRVEWGKLGLELLIGDDRRLRIGGGGQRLRRQRRAESEHASGCHTQ